MIQTVRRIAIVTVGRSDYQIYRSVFAALALRADVEYGLIVGGEHLVAASGDGLVEIGRHGHLVIDKVEMLLAGDDPSATSLSMAVGLGGFARSFARYRPDLIIVLGDRFEMFAAAAAAVPLGIPLLHLHGGEVTEGAMDERFRHAITKLSHLHCVATVLAGDRVRQMGEEPWRVHVTGAPGLDTALTVPPLDRGAFFSKLGMTDPGPFLLATYHSVTNEPDPEGRQIAELLLALRQVGLPVLFTTANADPGGHRINDLLWEEAKEAPHRVTVIRNLGELYGSAMVHASAMVGNSSSGIIEACSYDLPVVNIGIRQAGRERSANVLDCACEYGEIVAALHHALTPKSRAIAQAAPNIYGNGSAGTQIATIAAETPLDTRLRIKRFATWHQQ